jgi:hypothetical protein
MKANPCPNSSRKAWRRSTSAFSRSRSATGPVRSRKSRNVRVAGQLLGQLGVRGGQPSRKVGQGGADSSVQTVHDLVYQHVARPAVLDRGGGVPVPVPLIVEPVEQHRDVAPGKSSNRLLDDRCLLGPSGREGAHVEQVAPGQAAHLRKGDAQVGSESVDYPAAPALGLLAVQHRVPEAPVKPEQLGVDHSLGLPPGGPDRRLEVSEQLAVTGWQVDLGGAHAGSLVA